MTSATLRAVKLTKIKGSISLAQVVTQSARDTSTEAQREALADLLEAFKSGSGTKDTQLRVSIRGDEATIKYLAIPPLPDDELEDAVQLRVDVETAAASEPSSTQHFIADRNPMGIRVILVMLSSEKLDSLVQFCRYLEFPLDGVEVEAISYFTCACFEQISEGCVAVLDLRENGSALHVFGEFSPSLSRVLPDVGYERSSAADEASTEAGEENDVESTPRPGFASGPAVAADQAGAARLSRLAIRSLGKEISDTLQYLEYELGGSPVGKLILAGERSGEKQIVPELKAVLGLPVEPLGIPAFLRGVETEVDPRLFGIALGTAYGGLQDAN